MNKNFPMSKYANKQDRFEAMATHFQRLSESLEADKELLTAKVKDLEGNLQLTESLLGDNEHSYYLSTLTTNRGKE